MDPTLYAFKERLKHKCQGTNTIFVYQDESFTSKVCNQCNHKNDKLGISKIFVCPTCNYTTDRDVNGSINILRKYMRIFSIA